MSDSDRHKQATHNTETQQKTAEKNPPANKLTDSQKADTLNKIGADSSVNIWRGSNRPQQQRKKTISTGFTELDQQLHIGGWPLGITSELGISQHGIGELRLLIPALRALQQRSHEAQHIILVAPPFLPFAPSFIKEQIDVSQLTIVQTSNIQDTLWASEQCLLSKCCAAVLCWSGNYNLTTRELRRLQLAAEKSGSWNVLLRHSDCLSQSSASGLRIQLQSDSYSKLTLHIVKQPAGWAGQRLTLSLSPHYENWQRLPVGLLPHHNQTQVPIVPERIETPNQHLHQQASVTVLAPLSSLPTVH
ncbi:translesion DNA synthesis-associated protein ImuA [Arenicella xantha]|uniref:Protein ImuA n=1 Tax=Arenicella xantha TaxID=644221 RepID=A0A395JFV2_9GAMM|nr:translesion DNA synthesis-associated protein ImuA [Arenicella xantha]RBP48619.1 protein ImuA [Arenicella xantha]